MRRSIVPGILWALLGAFPMAAAVALCYRFPIPFAGYGSGPRAMLASPFAVLFYGTMGGFFVLAALGAAAGAAAGWLAGADARRARRLTFTFALAVDFLAVMALAVLDKIVGPW